MSISLDESAGVADVPTRNWKRLKKTSDIGDDERKRRQEHGRRVGGKNRVAGTCSSVTLAPCCACIYGVGIGIKKAGKILHINQNSVRKVLMGMGVYKGNTGRKPNPWKGGKVCSVRHEDLFSAYGYDKELRALKKIDDCKYWVRHPEVRQHLYGGKQRERSREQWAKMKNDPAFRARLRRNMASYRKRASKCSVWRMVQSIRSRTSAAIRRSNNGADRDERTIELLGCSYSFLRKWIKYQFARGMSFDNYGKWQVDHIVPVASFDLSSEVQRRICFHYSNLRPLWAKENREKSDSMVDCQPELVMSI